MKLKPWHAYYWPEYDKIVLAVGETVVVSSVTEPLSESVWAFLYWKQSPLVHLGKVDGI